ncbi:hypothetical protein [Raineyella sp. W15-4]|uniref:hypothetical protein n=1 Tax=Raineyella sp. W15-4 TaxID=3081651 RepID=UPI0029554A17|nr:hypothetical protein [Raineyella sp. W15-4]WOQ17593.1 hypothetical protein R0145_02455 [Raineyella sp. W15-4]
MALDEQVLTELRALRRRADGVTPTGVADCAVICHILGAGNPDIAYTALRDAILSLDQTTAIRAAAASLGFAASGSTHLDRLTEFGTAEGYDQRQVRRYSDKGLRQIASYLSSQWVLVASPKLTLTLTTPDEDHVWVHVSARRYYFIDMRTPELSLWQEDQRTIQAIDWRHGQSDAYDTTEGAALLPSTTPFIVSVIWHGELWPLFELDLDAHISRGVLTRSLGSHIQVALDNAS